jgi:asparagine synthase (glutamine-hydrolysing)
MCGIAAIFNYRTGQPVDHVEMERVLTHMQRRGPDGSGEWYGLRGTVGLGHRRLSIIDLSDAGAQPMASADGRIIVTFNGEIYNYRELRAELEAKGRHFRSQSDTEVLLHLYELEGPAMLRKLRGMYAFAIWDEEKRSLFLARDPFGIKPLYYADDGATFRAASQVKALLAGGRIDTSPESAGHVGFFLWGHVPAPYTLYRGIRALPAGCYMQVTSEGPTGVREFFSVTSIFAEAEQKASGFSSDAAPAPSAQSVLRSALVDSVRHHLIADVPVGVFLSSGLDSTSLAALAAESSASLRTVTLGFEEFRGTPDDETPLAEQVAAQYGARHQTIWVKQDDFRENLPRLLQAMDQPSCDGVNSFFISHAAAKAGLKVALSGLGGDELFGSYPSFREIPRAVRSLRPFSFSAFQPFSFFFRVVSAPVLKRLTSPKYAGLLEYGGTYGGAYLLRRSMFMPWELPEVLDADLVRDGWARLQTLTRLEETTQAIQSPYLRVAALEMGWYMRSQLLRDTDWASMDHSLEVRTPLVDTELLKRIAPLLADGTTLSKRDMARSSMSQLPTSVLNRPKTGFSIPVRNWLLSQNAGEGRQSAGAKGQERGLRGWAKLVYAEFDGAAKVHVARPGSPRATKRALEYGGRSAETVSATSASATKRILVLAGDAFGGDGGIAKFNRDLLTVLARSRAISEVVALPRIISQPIEPLPPKLVFVKQAANHKLRYAFQVLKAAVFSSRADLIICGHINLLPFAFLIRRLAELRGPRPSALRSRPPLVLVIHGIEAWKPRERFLVNRLAKRIDYFVAVSQLTKDRFLSWTGLPQDRGFILPNCVDASRFGPGPKNPALLKRYGLQDKTVILTFGRLASEERYKGFDEVLEILPALARQIPNLAYLIVGDGLDRPRLVQKARSLGLFVADFACARAPLSDPPSPMVVFAGRIPEQEKAEHYRLADAYVMPSHGEGFGIVYLEAMACGVPVVGSKKDGSREALRNGELGILVDPEDPDEIQAAALQALSANRPGALRAPPPGLDYFDTVNFEKRCHTLLEKLLPGPASPVSGMTS